MTVRNERDGVLIAGGGPVGLVAALTLALAGIPVTVLEAEPGIVPSPRALVYHAPTLEAFETLGILDDARAVGVLKQDYQFRDRASGRITRLDMSVLDGIVRYPFNLHLGQHVLAEIVMRHLLRHSHASVRWGTRVVDVAQDTEGVAVQVASEAGSETLRARYLVAADGARSFVRRAVGVEFAGHTWPERFIATNIRCDFEAHGYARATFVMDPEHWAIIVKISNDGMWRVTYGEDAALPEEGFRARIAGRFADIIPPGERCEIAAAAPYRVHERCCETFRAGRVLLAGDAAHACNPTGGYGLTSGLLDTITLGEALVGVLRAGADEDLLDSYATERRRVFREIASPAASENKRRLSERDPARHSEDAARLDRLEEDADALREMLSFSFRLRSAPLREAVDG